jgi:hypothetical protein
MRERHAPHAPNGTGNTEKPTKLPIRTGTRTLRKRRPRGAALLVTITTTNAKRPEQKHAPSRNKPLLRQSRFYHGHTTPDK